MHIPYTNPISKLDFYKTGHYRQYPTDTTLVVSNLTPRGSRIAGIDHVVWFGLQTYLLDTLLEEWSTLFSHSGADMIDEYEDLCRTSLNDPRYSADFLRSLRKLGYMPLEIRALPEGSRVPLRVPCMTIRNTHPNFAWLPNFLETQISASLWHASTSATIADAYRRVFEKYARETGSPIEFCDWQGHDFSYRGMSTTDAAALSSAGHLLSFTGTDTVPAIHLAREYYGATGFVGGSVPACYDDQTDVLTSRGFVRFSDLKESDLVAQYHENGTVTFVAPSARYACAYTGDMIHFMKNGWRYIDLVVTPNHRMVRRSTKTGSLSIFEAGSEDYKLRNGYSHRYGMIVSGKAVGEKTQLTPLEKLKIAFQADGSFPSRSSKYTGERSGKRPIRFSVKKDRKANRLKQICTDGEIEFTYSKHKSGYHSFWVKSEENFSKDFSWISLATVSATWANEFIQEISHWDGNVTKDRNCITYSSTVESCASMVQALAHIAGHKATLNAYNDPRGDRETIYQVCVLLDKTFVSGEDCQKTKVSYSGIVYCVSVPTKMLIVRRNNVVAVSGNTEHSVMTAEGEAGELRVLDHLFETYPRGILSVVSDSYDFWEFVAQLCTTHKSRILSRDGKFVVRPDSGDPADILCGEQFSSDSMKAKGLIEVLWDAFGGTVNEKGYKVLDPHIGAIYGDSITLERQEAILSRLKAKGFASCNVVLGIGSYTYQYVTRDTFGWAIKATYMVVNGEGRPIFKQPKTDSGIKKSIKGLPFVAKGTFEVTECVSWDRFTSNENALQPVWRDGKMLVLSDWADIRNRLAETRKV